MSVENADGTGKRLQCVSSDPMPTDSENGTTLHIIDTGEMYVRHDGGWEPDLRLIYALSVG